MILVCSIESDDRLCNEKLKGPFDKNNHTSGIVHLTVDENNSVIVRCRVMCKYPNGEYTPFVRIVNTETKREFDDKSESNNLYDLTHCQLTSTGCNFKENVTRFNEYTCRITIKSATDTINKSIVVCGLRNISRENLNGENYCYSSNFGWITNNFTEKPPIAHQRIPDEASIPVITIESAIIGIALLAIAVVLMIVVIPQIQKHCPKRRQTTPVKAFK